MRLCHTTPVAAARFDERNLVSASGLVPVMKFAADAGLGGLAGDLLTVRTDKGANAGGKVTALVCGMVAGADSIDDMALLRHGAMGRLFDRSYAPSTLGSFLREFTFGHVRQLDAVASRFLAALAGRTELFTGDPAGMVLVDIDDSIIEVHGHAKQGASFGYTRVRGLNMLLATASTQAAAPVVAAQRLRKGSCGSPRGAKRLVADALKTVRSLRPAGTTGPVLVRADSAFYGKPHHRRGGPGRRAGVGHGPDDPEHQGCDRQHRRRRLTTIDYTDAMRDEDTGELISSAEVAEIDFTASASAKKADRVVLDTVAADKTHRGHAIIEQVHADLKNSVLAHLPLLILSRPVDHAADLRFCVVDGGVDAGGEGSGQHGPISFDRCFPGVSRRSVVPRMAPVRCSPRACSTAFRSAWFSFSSRRIRSVAASSRRSSEGSEACCRWGGTRHRLAATVGVCAGV
jgi:hypothetical protein